MGRSRTKRARLNSREILRGGKSGVAAGLRGGNKPNVRENRAADDNPRSVTEPGPWSEIMLDAREGVRPTTTKI